jgi:hypothetical protein
MKTKRQKRVARQKRGPRLVDSSSIPKAQQVERDKVGCHYSPFLMMTSFRHPKATPEIIDGVRAMYRKRWFTQAQLAEMFDLSAGVVSKMVRTDPFWRS